MASTDLPAVELGFQSGVPGDLPLTPQPVLQAYFILNADRTCLPSPAGSELTRL